MEDKHFESLYPAETMYEEIEKTLGIIRSGGFVQAVGLPGVGKSTLLRLLAYNSAVRDKHLGQEADVFHFVYMNFSEVKHREHGDVIKFMLLSLESSLRAWESFEEADFVSGKLAWALPLSDEMVFFQALRESVEHLTTQKGLKIVFLIDRLGAYFPNIQEQFFINLRLLRNSAKYHFSVVFSVSRPLDMILGKEMTQEVHDLLLGNTVFVGICHMEGLLFRMQYLERAIGKTCEKETKDALITLTGGHGKLTKSGYEALLNDGLHGDLEEFLLSRRQTEHALSEIWNYFTGEEQHALARGVGSPFVLSLGVLKDGEITIPLLATYIVSQKAKLEALLYDEERKVITRGGRDISEMFSPSEFKLLVCLLTRRGEVIDRDSLIDVVWGDLASQEGVTPQAFDQLLYRVRKKIEADVDSPQIIETVKGRGVRIADSL